MFRRLYSASFNKIVNTCNNRSSSKNFEFKKNLCFYTKSKNTYSNNYKRPAPKILVSGLLTWLGLATEEDPNAEHDSNLVVTVKRGILASREGDHKRAQQIFHLALRQASEFGDEEAVNHIYCLLAGTAMDMSLFSEAERLYTQVLKRILANGEAEDSNAVVDISLKMAHIRTVRNDFENAEIGYKFCVDSQKAKIDKLGGKDVDEDTMALYGISMERFAQFLVSRNRLQEAETLYKKGFEVAKNLLGEEHDQTLVIQNSLASVVSMRGDYKQAEQILSEVIKTAEQISCPHLPTFLINRGLNRMMTGMLSSAQSDCTQAKTVAQQNESFEEVEEANNCLEQVKVAFN